MIPVSKKDHSLLLALLYITVSIYRSLLSVLTAFVLHVWKDCSRRVYFTNFRQEYINDRKKAEEGGETREETRMSDLKNEVEKL